MGTNSVDILSRHPVSRHRITLEDYHRLGHAGILGEDDRIELLDGQLVDMSPIGPRHALAVDALTRLLVMAVAGRAAVRVQNPIELDATTEPQPDIALVWQRWRGYPDAHPRPADMFLLVDRGAKLELYARAGIREFWIVDVTTNSVLVHRRPRGIGYDLVTKIEPPGALEVEDLAGVQIPPATLFV